jgi:hypothetical protein
VGLKGQACGVHSQLSCDQVGLLVGTRPWIIPGLDNGRVFLLIDGKTKQLKKR